MRLIKGILDLAAAVLLLMLILLSVPKIWGFQIYTVTSASMAPQLLPGDVIYVKEREDKTLKEGDIVTYSLNAGKTLVTHRVVAVDQKHRAIQTKGDANECTDGGWISDQQVLGVVQHSLRGLGYPAMLLASLEGKLFLAAVFLWIAAAGLVLKNLEEMYGGKELYEA